VRLPQYVLLAQFKGILMLFGAVAFAAPVGVINLGDNLNAARVNTIVTHGGAKWSRPQPVPNR